MLIQCTKLWKECVYRHFYSHFYRHFDSHTILLLLSTFLTDIFFYRHISVKFDGHHPMLMVCQIIEFAIVFFYFCITWLINTWRYTYIKYGWNAGEYNEENYANKVSIVISIVTFDCDILAFEFIFAIDIWDRLAFLLSSFLDRWLKFYRLIWVTDSI